MFGKKLHVDVKKSTLKIQDVKKDSATRFKHLKIVLENVDIDEAKGFFEANFSHIYFILYDCFVTAEVNLRQRELSFHLVHKAHREELEQVLHMLEKVLTLLPELLNRRWQLHSLARMLIKLMHPGNSWKVRKQAIRYFILWYQALGDNAPDNIHHMFTCLVPGLASLHHVEKKSPATEGAKKDATKQPGAGKFLSLDEKRETHEPYSLQSLFLENPGAPQGPVSPVDNLPILPPQSGEKPLENETVQFLEALLQFMVTQVVKIEWRDKHARQYKCLQFLLERFKATYLRYICPEFDDNFSLYRPNLELPVMRKPAKNPNDNLTLCKVVLIKWIASFTHVVKIDTPFSSYLSQSGNAGETSMESEAGRSAQSMTMDMNSTCSTLASEPPSMTLQQTYDDSVESAKALVGQVLYGNRENVNFVHEIYRQAFLLDFVHAGAIRKAIGAYKDWIQSSEMPPFMLEPLEGYREKDLEELEKNDGVEHEESYSRLGRLRNDSYVGAITKENLFVRAGLQNVLQVFITQSSNVFFLSTPSIFATPSHYEEQSDSCKRVLNVYRYVVMHTRLTPATWEQLLRVLLQITSLTLGGKNKIHKQQENIGKKLANAVFQTLIVTWIKANLNVVISTQLWDQFLQVLTSLTNWEELIREWTKTLDTLTKVLARHMYNLDLNDLPLDRLSEQKTKRRRGVGGRAASTGNVKSPPSIDQASIRSSKDNAIDHPLRESRKFRHLLRSASDNALYHGKSNRHKNLKNRVHIAHREMLVLPLSIEQDMARVLSNGATTNSNWKRLSKGRSKSLESVMAFDSESPSPPCCPSPTPSSGVDSNKDSPIQIDHIDGNSIVRCYSDTSDASAATEKRSVMSGGGARGWLPDVAVVLWRRMLSVLGDVNNVQDPVLHGQVMEYLVKMTQTLIKVRMNQGVSGDNQVTLPAPEFIPPFTVIAPWCFKAIQLPQEFQIGKIAAYRLICLLTVQPLDIDLPRQHLSLFYYAVHSGIFSGDLQVLYTLVRHTGPRLFSLNLPGSSLLILDFIHAADVILGSQDLEAPRTEAVAILGSLLSLPATLAKLPTLQPSGSKIGMTTNSYTKEHIIKLLLQSCQREPTAEARCVALSSIAIFAYRELSCRSAHRTVPEAIMMLVMALRAKHANVAQVACDCLQLLCDKADFLTELYPDVPAKVIQSLSETLELTTAQGNHGALATSMLFCLGEWAMHLGPNLLLRVFHGKSLLMTLFTVLDNIIQRKVEKKKEQELDDFDVEMTLDNLAYGNRTTTGGMTSEAIRLAAKTVMMHLVNHLGHFPMGIGASRLSSMVVELDDIPGIDGDELSTAIFQAPNVQLLMLSDSIVMSLVELDTLDAPGGGVTAGLTTAPSVVRVLLRDLAGKASWDSSILYNQPSASNDLAPLLSCCTKSDWDAETEKEEMCSVLLPSQSCLPRHTMRHREPHVLPTFANAASDMDNLDDLLRYIGHTSPEVLVNPETSLNSPANPPQTQYLEGENIAAILNQRNAEREHVNSWNQHVSMSASVVGPPSCRSPPAPFHHCRLLFSHLGLSGWEQRRKLHLLARNEKLLRELRNLDSQRSRETHKMAVVYVSQGQEDKNSILSNVTASKEYEDFVARLAWEVELESHTGFLGGLIPGKATGVTAPYYATSFTEIIFHVATRMPSDSPESLLQKTRHLGNDEIHIVWSEHWRDYRRDIIPTEFCDVLIVIYPLVNKMYRVQVSRKTEIPFFGPLYDECIVEDSVLPSLVRTTALAASRAKRSTLNFYQHYYEERARSIDTIVRNHKEATTFEQFAAKVYSPVQPQSPFSCASSICGSTTSVQSTASSNLAAVLIDSHHGRAGLRNTPTSNSDNRANRVSDGGRVWFSSDASQDNTSFHGISPRPVKKMSFKSGTKHKSVPQVTPPDSPRYK